MNNLLILGSGRSGTSMITGSLSEAGYFLGANAEYLGENKANPKGFFEDYEVNTINEDILKQNLWNFPERIRRKFFPSYTFYRARWLARISSKKYIKNRDSSITKRISTVVAHTPFCYKDPRFSYTLPIWEPLLPPDTKFIVVFREPSKTAESIVRECKELKALKKLKMNYEIAQEVWYSMYSHVLKHYQAGKNADKWFFIHYDQIFNADSVQALKDFTGANVQMDFAEKNISRSSDVHVSVSAKVKALYGNLCSLASYREA